MQCSMAAKTMPDVQQEVGWMWALLPLAVAPAVLEGQDLPTLLFYDELENINIDTWLGFQHMLVPTDR